MINAWWCLFKKEFRLMRSFLLANGTVLISGGLIGADLAYRTHSGMSSFFLFVVMVWHFFYLLVYLIVSLWAEKNHAPIWMQSPQSAWVLLSAKFAAGLLLMYVSLFLHFALWLWVLHLEFQTGSFQGVNNLRFLLPVADLIKQHGSLLLLIFAQRGLLLAVLGTCIFLFVSLFQRLQGVWRWILSLILFVTTVILIRLFSETKIYDTLFHWGGQDLSGFSSLIPVKFEGGPPLHQILHNLFGRPIYYGDLVFGFLLSVIGFYLAGWLLDRKVEV